MAETDPKKAETKKTDPNERIIRNRLAEAHADIKDAKDLGGQDRYETILRAVRALSQAVEAAGKTEGVTPLQMAVTV